MMFYRLKLILKNPGTRLWITPALWGLAAIFFAFSARLAGIFLEPDILPEISLGSLESLLNVIASSMLAVSTFSLSVMVSAFSSVSGSTAPTATELVVGDNQTRRAISSFISAFIYAVIAKTALGMEFYSQNGIFVLFVSTVLVMAYVVATLIRWVHTLSHLGRFGNTLDKIEAAAAESLRAYRRNPNLGAAWKGRLEQGHAVKIANVGYLTHINMEALQQAAGQNDAFFHICVRPGDLIVPDRVLLLSSKPVENPQPLQSCFITANKRNFDEDPGWGFAVLGEVVQRALSASVDDSDTAIVGMIRIMKLVLEEKPETEAQAKAEYDRLAIVPADRAKWITDTFMPLSRSAADILEVALVMQQILFSIRNGTRDPVLAQAAEDAAHAALARAREKMSFEADRQALFAEHRKLCGCKQDIGKPQEA